MSGINRLNNLDNTGRFNGDSFLAINSNYLDDNLLAKDV